MKTNDKNNRTLLSLALVASLSATVLFVASAEEAPAREPTPATTTAATTDALQPPADAAPVPVSPVIELPPTTTLAGDPTVDADRAQALEPPLEPGDYIWHPEASPSGDVVILVSIPRQELNVYRGGIRIARSTISSGKPGHDTPVGVFPILQKKKMHHSNLYDDAPMPFMQRLTWGGIALHAGRLPGYPASHGCIRLPHEFSKLLFDVTNHRSTTVVVADESMLGRDVLEAPGEFAPTQLLALAESLDENSTK